MGSSFTAYASRINDAKSPEDLFGFPGETVSNLVDYIHYQFRQIGKYVHPDRNGFSPESHDAFARLNAFKVSALEKIDRGTYGSNPSMLSFASKLGNIEVYEKFSSWPISRQHLAFGPKNKPFLFSFATTPSLNNFIQHETTIYELIMKNLQPSFLDCFLPLADTGIVKDSSGHQYNYNLFDFSSEYITLEQLIAAYPKGLDPKDAAWIYNQLLDILGILYANDIVHGAILPSNILVGLGDLHKTHLINFNVASIGTSPISAMIKGKEDYYPYEIKNKLHVSCGSDLYMLSKCMIALTEPSSPIAPFFTSFLTLSKTTRTINPFSIRHQFIDLIEKLWGPRQYHPLTLPK